MARKKVREYDAKRMVKAALARLAGVELPLKAVQVKEREGGGGGSERIGRGCRPALFVSHCSRSARWGQTLGRPRSMQEV